jgi:hypothetical protein
MRSQVRSASGLNVLAGIWLIVAPFLLGYADTQAALWNDIIIGIVVLIIASARASMPEKMPAASWLNAVLGAWLIIAPFALGYSEVGAGTWNDILLGIIVLVLASWSALAGQRLQSSGSGSVA